MDIWGFAKMVGFPNKPIGFPTKSDHFGVQRLFHSSEETLHISIEVWVLMLCILAARFWLNGMHRNKYILHTCSMARKKSLSVLRFSQSASILQPASARDGSSLTKNKWRP